MSLYDVSVGHTNSELRKKGSLNTNFNLERNFADISTTCSSLLHLVETSAKFLSELKLVFREPILRSPLCNSELIRVIVM